MGEKQKPTRWWLWLAATLAFPAMYLLSLGPAIRLRDTGYLHPTIFAVYWSPYAGAKSILPHRVGVFMDGYAFCLDWDKP